MGMPGAPTPTAPNPKSAPGESCRTSAAAVIRLQLCRVGSWGSPHLKNTRHRRQKGTFPWEKVSTIQILHKFMPRHLKKHHSISGLTLLMGKYKQGVGKEEICSFPFPSAVFSVGVNHAIGSQSDPTPNSHWRGKIGAQTMKYFWQHPLPPEHTVHHSFRVGQCFPGPYHEEPGESLKDTYHLGLCTL